MRLAVIANVHGNLPALEAVLEHIQSLDVPVDRVLCAGDVVGHGPHPNEVLNLLRSRDIETVLGNYDDAVAFERLHSGTDFPDSAAEELDRRSINWTRNALTEENTAHLQNLPQRMRLIHSRNRLETSVGNPRNEGGRMVLRTLFGNTFKPRPNPNKRVLVLHGSPRSLNEFVREDTANSIFTTLIDAAKADVVICSHDETVFKRRVGGTTFVGAGSVSGLRSTAGRAEYVVVTVDRDVEVEAKHASYAPIPYLRSVETQNLSVVN